MSPLSRLVLGGTGTLVMGVVNVTDDSFSDGGLFLDRDRAVEQGLKLVADGAAIVDVGGESTRPGAVRVDARVEIARVLPVVKDLAAQGVTVSIDTMHADVARAALQSGAKIVNDVSGGQADPGMAPLVAEAGVPWILMHWRSVGASRSHRIPAYADVVADVRAELMTAVDAAVAGGVDPAQLIIDPGLGFAKSAEHNWALLRALPEFVGTGLPVLVGASRKRFLGTLLADDDGDPRPPAGRETATAVISALAARHGAWGVRVHDARASVDAVKVVDAWERSDQKNETSAWERSDQKNETSAWERSDQKNETSAWERSDQKNETSAWERSDQKNETSAWERSDQRDETGG